MDMAVCVICKRERPVSILREIFGPRKYATVRACVTHPGVMRQNAQWKETLAALHVAALKEDARVLALRAEIDIIDEKIKNREEKE